MTTLATPPVPGSPLPGLVPYRLSVGQYEAMVASGAFTKRDRLELIEGILVRKTTKGRKHSAGSEKFHRMIDRALPPGWHARVEKPVRLPDRNSMPEPDVSVARGEPDDYLDLDPGPDDVALIVEVSDTTLA
ncbi:MAG: Uma2 family endonuclease, partial [Isosphaeraceae bacterium]